MTGWATFNIEFCGANLFYLLLLFFFCLGCSFYLTCFVPCSDYFVTFCFCSCLLLFILQHTGSRVDDETVIASSDFFFKRPHFGNVKHEGLTRH